MLLKQAPNRGHQSMLVVTQQELNRDKSRQSLVTMGFESRPTYSIDGHTVSMNIFTRFSVNISALFHKGYYCHYRLGQLRVHVWGFLPWTP